MSKADKELAELTAMDLPDLRERWAEQNDTPAPPALTLPLLRHLIAQQLQERRHGGLSALVASELERVGSNSSTTTAPLPRPTLTPGTRLFREWQGRTIAVEVTDGGFVWEGKTWRSLSEIARSVTGAQWSGPRFFGLRRRG